MVKFGLFCTMTLHLFLAHQATAAALSCDQILVRPISAILAPSLTGHNSSLRFQGLSFESHEYGALASARSQLTASESKILAEALISGKDELRQILNFHQITYGLELLSEKFKAEYLKVIEKLLSQPRSLAPQLELVRLGRSHTSISSMRWAIVQSAMSTIMYHIYRPATVSPESPAAMLEEAELRLGFLKIIAADEELIKQVAERDSNLHNWALPNLRLLNLSRAGENPRNQAGLDALGLILARHVHFRLQELRLTLEDHRRDPRLVRSDLFAWVNVVHVSRTGMYYFHSVDDHDFFEQLSVSLEEIESILEEIGQLQGIQTWLRPPSEVLQ